MVLTVTTRLKSQVAITPLSNAHSTVQHSYAVPSGAVLCSALSAALSALRCCAFLCSTYRKKRLPSCSSLPRNGIWSFREKEEVIHVPHNLFLFRELQRKQFQVPSSFPFSGVSEIWKITVLLEILIDSVYISHCGFMFYEHRICATSMNSRSNNSNMELMETLFYLHTEYNPIICELWPDRLHI